MLPLDASVATRLVAPRPNITARPERIRLYGEPLTGIPQGDSPQSAQHLVHHHRGHRHAGGGGGGHDADITAAGLAATAFTC